MAQKAARSIEASHISRLPVSGPLCCLPVGLSGPLGHVGHHLLTWSLTRRPRQCLNAGWNSSGGSGRMPTLRSRLRRGPRWNGDSRRITLGQDVLYGLSLLLYCQELLGEVLDSVAE